MWPKKCASFVLVALALVGCSADGTSLSGFDAFLWRSSNLPAPKVSREQAIEWANGHLPIASDFTLDLAVLTTPKDVARGKIPGRTAISGIGLGVYGAFGVKPDDRFWLIRFKKGDSENGLPYALINYLVHGETGDVNLLLGEGSGPPASQP